MLLFVYRFFSQKLVIAFKRLLSLLHTCCMLFPDAPVELSNAYQCHLPDAHKHHIISQCPAPPGSSTFLLRLRLSLSRCPPGTSLGLCVLDPCFSWTSCLPRVYFTSLFGESTSSSSFLRKGAWEAKIFEAT